MMTEATLARRPQLVESAVVEAARRYVAAHLLVERAAGRGDTAETVAVFDRDDALQSLRDCLAAHSRVRR